jgi:hypothetical protein
MLVYLFLTAERTQAMTRQMIRLFPALIVSAAVTNSYVLAKESELNQPPEGFTALFNGKDLTGWNVSEKNAQHWKVEEGVIVYDGKGSSLPTAEEYGDFELYVDWKIEKGADSGIYLRGKPQVQIWTRDEGSGGLWNNKRTNIGAKPLVAADNPVGEWNTFKIKLVGDKVTVFLNDKLVVDNAPMETLKKGDQIIERGPILLQHHGNPLQFRSIFIKPLTE